MKSHNIEYTCQQAGVFFYDLLFGEAEGQVPKTVQDHVSQCSSCQAEMQHLRQELNETDTHESSQGHGSSSLANALKLHFAYTNCQVACKHVKPFLPTLVAPNSKIRIATPITVHIDQCPACAADLKTVRKLNLTSAQLCQLAQLYSENPPEDCLSGLEQIHEVAEAIRRRPESGITTCYRVGASNEEDQEICVEITKPRRAKDRNVQQPISTQDWSATGTRERSVRASLLRRLAKPLTAAAAILIVAVLLTNISSVRAVSLEQICRAIASAKVVYVSRFGPGQSEPYQQVWTSRPQGLKLHKDKKGLVLLDLNQRSKKVRTAGNPEAVVTSMSEDDATGLREHFDNYFGLLPFTDAEHPIILDSSIVTLVHMELDSIAGAACGEQCNQTIQEADELECDSTGGSCPGSHTIIYERMGCGSATSGTCPTSDMVSYKDSPCQEDPHNVGSCTGNDEWTSYEIKACN